MQMQLSSGQPASTKISRPDAFSTASLAEHGEVWRRQGGGPGSNQTRGTAACREGAMGGREGQRQEAELQVGGGPQWASRVFALSRKCWPCLYA